MGERYAKTVVFVGPRSVRVEDRPLPPMGPADVVVKTIASGISAGTEMNVYRASAPQWTKRVNKVTGLYEAHTGGQWKYPFVYGYQSVGRVVARGDDVSSPEIGDLVVSRSAHQSLVVEDAEEFTLLPPLLDPRHGVLAVNLETALRGVHNAHSQIGDAVVVSGLGVVGLLTTMLLRRNGAGLVVGVDVSEHRRNLARTLGADAVFAPAAAVEGVRELTENRGAETVIEASGAAGALQTAVRTVGFGGRVILISWYREPIASLNLSDEFFDNGVKILATGAGELPAPLAPTWSDERVLRFTASLTAELDLAPLFTHDFPIEQAAEAYRAVDEGREGLVQCTFSYPA